MCGESTHEYYHDFPVAGPCSAIEVCKHFLRHGGTPKMWLQQWCQDKGISQRDRVCNELDAVEGPCTMRHDMAAVSVDHWSDSVCRSVASELNPDMGCDVGE